MYQMRHRKTWKLGRLSVLLLMIVSLIAGCSSNSSNGNTGNTGNNGNNGNKGNTADNDGGNAGSSSGKKLSFSYLRPTWGPATYTKNGAYEKELFKQANVDIDVRIIPVVDYDSTIKTTAASGDMPDAVWATGPVDPFWKDLQDQDAFTKLNDLLDKYPAVKAAVPDGIWDKMKDDKGDIYFIPNLIYPVVPFFINYRADIFEKLGIAEPTSIAELEAALQKIKESEPGIVPMTHGNTIPFWAGKDVATSFGDAYGWAPSKDDPNKLLPPEMQDEHLNYMFWLQDLKKKGLFDEEAGVNPDASFGETKFKAGKAAVILGGNLQSLLPELRKADPKATIKTMSPLAGPDGQKGGTRVVFPQDRGFYINKKAEGKADQIFQFLNWSLTDGSDFRRYGIEGKTYTVDDQGRKVPIPDDERESDYKSSQIEPLRFLDPMSEKLDWQAIELQFAGGGMQDQFAYYKSMFEKYAATPYNDYKDPTVSSPTNAKIGAQIYEDYMAKVSGSILTDMKLTKDDYIKARQKWLDAGEQKIIDEVNELQKDKSEPNYVD
ncbi:extracellular solute-binding protein [Paenibacillus sacheonensis]|uniref:Extracellular solute-binding protein n=1 Tax=Paenibacillus sacheonensis TaxID=742054 RepID=A0A7X4YS28_9BACL|nr:extracellular solute-binding protein [Paenibacillus sacheonensis]MBM7566818.1 ABC-type glycerol-3-phosphate transport system substrate-binding protein [Paenibacillus sacheonensis]NBC71440.1 extracellular solute-binding protein [Paenibacillus sacheonensis]